MSDKSEDEETVGMDTDDEQTDEQREESADTNHPRQNRKRPLSPIRDELSTKPASNHLDKTSDSAKSKSTSSEAPPDSCRPRLAESSSTSSEQTTTIEEDESEEPTEYDSQPNVTVSPSDADDENLGEQPTVFTSRWAMSDSSGSGQMSSDVESQTNYKEADFQHEPRPYTWSCLKGLYRRESGRTSGVRFKWQLRSSRHVVQRLKMSTILDGHNGCVNCLNFSTSGALLASGSDDRRIFVWDWANGKKTLSFDSKHHSNVFQCKFLPCSDDLHMVSCARDGQVRLHQLSYSGELRSTRRVALHRDAAHKIGIRSDSSNLLYSAGEDAVVYEIDLREKRPNKILVVKADQSVGRSRRFLAIYSVDANPVNSNYFVLGCRDLHVREYDRRALGSPAGSNAPVKSFHPHHLNDESEHSKPNVTCAVYNYDGKEILATYNDDDIYLFDETQSDGADAVHRYRGHRNDQTVKGVNFYGPRSEFIVSGSDCNNVYFWEKESEALLNFQHGDDGGVVNVLEPHPYEPTLATSGLDHTVKIWEPIAHWDLFRKRVTDQDTSARSESLRAQRWRWSTNDESESANLEKTYPCDDLQYPIVCKCSAEKKASCPRDQFYFCHTKLNTQMKQNYVERENSRDYDGMSPGIDMRIIQLLMRVGARSRLVDDDDDDEMGDIGEDADRSTSSERDDDEDNDHNDHDGDDDDDDDADDDDRPLPRRFQSFDCAPS